MGPKKIGSKNVGPKKIVTQNVGPTKFVSCKKKSQVYKCLSENNDHPVPSHHGSLFILYLWISLYPVTLVTLSAAFMDHPVSCDYELLCKLWPWITLYSLTMDHPVLSDNRLPCIQVSLPSKVVGLLITTLFERINPPGWVGGWIGGWVGGWVVLQGNIATSWPHLAS